MLIALQVQATHDGTLDDTLVLIDGISIRAQHQAAGAKKGARAPNSGAVAVAGEASCTW